MKGGHDSAAGVRIQHGAADLAGSWPMGQDAWTAHASELGARYPLMVEDWTQHAECVESGFYSVRKRTETPGPAAAPTCENAQEPLSPEHEEMLF